MIRITIEGPPTEGKTHIKHTIVTALRRAGFEDVVVEGDPIDRPIEGRIRGVLQERQLEITLVERMTSGASKHWKPGENQMQLTQTPDRRSKCKAKNIDPGSCLMKQGGHVVYMRTDQHSGTQGQLHLVNLENGKTSRVDPEAQVYIIDAGPLTWAFRVIG